MKIGCGERRRPGGTKLLIIIQTKSRNHDQPPVKKLKLLLQVVANVSDGRIGAGPVSWEIAGKRVGGGRSPIVLDSESRRTPIFKAVVGLKFPGNDLLAKKINGEGIAGKAEKNAGIDVVFKLVMFFV